MLSNKDAMTLFLVRNYSYLEILKFKDSLEDKKYGALSILSRMTFLLKLSLHNYASNNSQVLSDVLGKQYQALTEVSLDTKSLSYNSYFILMTKDKIQKSISEIENMMELDESLPLFEQHEYINGKPIKVEAQSNLALFNYYYGKMVMNDAIAVSKDLSLSIQSYKDMLDYHLSSATNQDFKAIQKQKDDIKKQTSTVYFLDEQIATLKRCLLLIDHINKEGQDIKDITSLTSPSDMLRIAKIMEVLK